MIIETHYLLLSLAATNFAAFAATAPSIFDDSRLEARRKTPFATAYFSAAFVSLYGLFQNPAADGLRSLVSGLTLVISMAMFCAAAKATRTRRLTWIFSPDSPIHVVQQGPYQYIRHPFYAAYLSTFAAVAVASNHVLSSIAMCAMATMYTMQTKSEEGKFARGPLAAEYARYTERAGRFWPRPIMIFKQVRYWVTARR